MGHRRRTNGSAAKLELGKRVEGMWFHSKHYFHPSFFSPPDEVDDDIVFHEMEEYELSRSHLFSAGDCRQS
jgi:hypothetical protein